MIIIITHYLQESLWGAPEQVHEEGVEAGGGWNPDGGLKKFSDDMANAEI